MVNNFAIQRYDAVGALAPTMAAAERQQNATVPAALTVPAPVRTLTSGGARASNKWKRWAINDNTDGSQTKIWTIRQ